MIREVVKATGDIITVAGNGTAGYSGDNGPATAAELDDPGGVAVDSAGDLFVADTGNNVVREVTPAVTVTIIPSPTPTPPVTNGDNGPADRRQARRQPGRAAPTSTPRATCSYADTEQPASSASSRRP